MNISYGKINEEIFKILKGLGYAVKMYDAEGNGPIASPKLARYIYVEPDHFMISLPSGTSLMGEEGDVIIYKSDTMDLSDFKNIHNRIRKITHMSGLSTRVKSFGQEISPKSFVPKIKARQEEEELSESSKPKIKSLFEYLIK